MKSLSGPLISGILLLTMAACGGSGGSSEFKLRTPCDFDLRVAGAVNGSFEIDDSYACGSLGDGISIASLDNSDFLEVDVRIIIELSTQMEKQDMDGRSIIEIEKFSFQKGEKVWSLSNSCYLVANLGADKDDKAFQGVYDYMEISGTVVCPQALQAESDTGASGTVTLESASFRSEYAFAPDESLAAE